MHDCAATQAFPGRRLERWRYCGVRGSIESWGDPLMLRTVAPLIMVTFLLLQAHAEEAMTMPQWSAATAPPRSPILKSPEVIRVQEPYCEYGVGTCGGTCSEEGGKRWACASEELPCYQLGRCKCEPANVCKPAPAPKKKKTTTGDKPNEG